MITGKTNLLSRLADNLQMFIGSGRNVQIPEVIYPVADIYKSGKTMLLYNDVTISSTGNFLAFTVPDNEYWTLHLMNVSVGSGVWTVYAVFLQPAYATRYNMDTKASTDPDTWTPMASASYTYWYINTVASVITVDGTYKDVRIPPQTRIYIVADAYTSSGAAKCFLLATREIIK